jgi:hypothetical protein
MGWLDRLLRPFRREAPEATPEPPPTRAHEPPAAPAGAPAPAPAAAPKAARPAAPPPPPKVRPPRSSKARKARKAPPPPPGRRADVEVLTVEEAERRYRATLDAETRRAPEPPPPAPVAVASAPPPPPPIARPRPKERRSAPAAHYERLLSRVDALLAVPAAEAAHLATARRGLLADWERLGPPAADDRARLDAARDARLAALDERARAAGESLRAAYAANLALRLAVVDEARALAERDDLRDAGPAMGRLRAKLRAVGPVAAEDLARVDTAFAEAEARLAARRSAQRQERDEARARQLAALDRLVGQAESLVRASDPEAAAERAKALQLEWKGVRVPGPRAEGDERWTRFRSACDAVFARRAAARAEGAKAAIERLERIVTQVEAVAAGDGAVDPDEVVRRALADWKRAGRAPREAQDALWERLQRSFDALRSPAVALPAGEAAELQFRPFANLRSDGG